MSLSLFFSYFFLALAFYFILKCWLLPTFLPPTLPWWARLSVWSRNPDQIQKTDTGRWKGKNVENTFECLFTAISCNIESFKYLFNFIFAFWDHLESKCCAGLVTSSISGWTVVVRKNSLGASYSSLCPLQLLLEYVAWRNDKYNHIELLWRA